MIMQGQVDIKHLNTLREFMLCNALGYSVALGGISVTFNSVADLIEERTRLQNLLFENKNQLTNDMCIYALNTITAFFYRCHISEVGDKMHRDEIREFTLKEDYWTEI